MATKKPKPTQRLIDLVNEVVEDSILLADGFDEAFLGIATRCGQPPVAVYDAEHCIQILMDRDGMDYEEALEFFSFNVTGAWVGPQTPMFVEKVEGWERGVDDWAKPPM